jgi:hypothetical protein
MQNGPKQMQSSFYDQHNINTMLDLSTLCSTHLLRAAVIVTCAAGSGSVTWTFASQASLAPALVVYRSGYISFNLLYH